MVEKQTFSRNITSEDLDFADNVRRIRELKGWSQGELARRISKLGVEGFHQTTISRIEKGERLVRLGEARSIARALNRPVDHFLQSSRDVEPLEKLKEDRHRAAAAGRELTAAVREYQEAMDVLAKDVERAKSILNRPDDELPTTHFELERWIGEAEKQLEYKLDNIADWPNIGPRRHDEKWRKRLDGEHPEEG